MGIIRTVSPEHENVVADCPGLDSEPITIMAATTG